jgi:hypothetical protein
MGVGAHVQEGLVSTTTELDELAHELALENAEALIWSYSIELCEDAETWQDLSDVDEEDAQAIDQALRYLELRGALVRHKHRREWVQICEPQPLGVKA